MSEGGQEATRSSALGLVSPTAVHPSTSVPLKLTPHGRVVCEPLLLERPMGWIRTRTDSQALAVRAALLANRQRGETLLSRSGRP